MRLTDLYRDAIAQLQQAGIENPQVDAALLVDFCFGVSRSQLFLAAEYNAPADKLTLFQQLLARRLTREPLSYLTGSREFWSLDFIVSPAVLIPRPETEFLLTKVLSVPGPERFSGELLLDMCTGSGVIATVLAREFAQARIVASDCSVAALAIARQNIEKHGVEERVSLLAADLFTAFRSDQRFALMVANPPYIADEVFATLQPEVRDFEPQSALLGGVRGLAVIERLAIETPLHLKPGGWLFVEIGADQAQAVRTLFSQHLSGQYHYDAVEIIDDWAGRPRVLQARLELS